MRKSIISSTALVLAVLTLHTGCTPTQPFYFREDSDLSFYLDKATEIETPDVDSTRLSEVNNAMAPLTITNPDFDQWWDLSVEDCINLALQNSKVFRNLGQVSRVSDNQTLIPDGVLRNADALQTIYNPAILESDPQLGVEAALAEFDTQFTTKFFWQNTDRPQNLGPVAISSGFQPLVRRQDLMQLDTNFIKKTPSGAQFRLGNSTINDWNNTPSEFRSLPSDWFTAYEAEWTQPLMQGRGTQINRIPITLARIRTDIGLADFESAVRDLCYNVEIAYWDLAIAFRQLETAKLGRDAAHATWQIVDLKFKGKMEDTQKLSQAKEQYYFFLAQVQQALKSLQDAERNLRLLMGLTPTDQRLIRPKQEPTTALVDFDWYTIHEEGLTRSPELRRQRWRIKQRELQILAARNLVLPQVNVVALYRWLGLGDDLIGPRKGLNFPTDGSYAYDVLTEGDFQEARLGLEITPPRFGARRELAGVRNAELNLANEHAKLEDMELTLSHNLSTTIGTLDASYEMAKTNFNRWTATQEEVETVFLIYENDLATLDLVLDAQRRRAQAQLEYYRNLINYNKAIAEVHFRKGTLLDYDNVLLAEGPWPSKAYWDAEGQARRRGAGTVFNYGWTRPNVVSEGAAPQGAMGVMSEGQVIEEVAPGQVIESVPTPAEEIAPPVEGVIPPAAPENAAPPANTPPSTDLNNSSAGVPSSRGRPAAAQSEQPIGTGVRRSSGALNGPMQSSNNRTTSRRVSWSGNDLQTPAKR
jgi:outer membrane protein TolC